MATLASTPTALRAVTLAYTLRNGHRGTLTCVARNTADAVGVAIDTFGDQLRSCAARPLVAAPANHGTTP